uniref:Uncharacterized protein n=1 Tax=Mandrillus leucophaeus TaxID=9568 RepID=A0A2K6AGI3_MANLE
MQLLENLESCIPYIMFLFYRITLRRLLCPAMIPYVMFLFYRITLRRLLLLCPTLIPYVMFLLYRITLRRLLRPALMLQLTPGWSSY